MEYREFKQFVQATRAHVLAHEILANLIGARERFAEARLIVAETYAECKAAQSALGTHREYHNCGTATVKTVNSLDEHTRLSNRSGRVSVTVLLVGTVRRAGFLRVGHVANSDV